VQTLLKRCASEDDLVARELLASCWGEVGAIGSHLLGEVAVGGSSGKAKAGSADTDSHAWRLANAPWQSQPTRYQLHVVTTHLVIALKAARTANDQHKIAFTIQQILVLLDKSTSQGTIDSSGRAGNQVRGEASATKGEMSEWLREKLTKAEVIDTVEPYWQSQFKQVVSRTRCQQCIC
jgi:hypothetical protein